MSPASQPSHETAPRDPRAYSNLRHGLTGRIYLFGEEEQNAYDNLRRSLLESWAPANEKEASLTSEIIDDTWRLSRARTFESALLASHAEKFAASEQATGDPQLDEALGYAAAWTAEAKNLNLLSLYENRTHSRRNRNVRELTRLQSERKQALEAATQEAAILTRQAESNGKNYNPAEAFLARGFEFSADEITRLVARFLRILDARAALRSPKSTYRKAA